VDFDCRHTALTTLATNRASRYVLVSPLAFAHVAQSRLCVVPPPTWERRKPGLASAIMGHRGEESSRALFVFAYANTQEATPHSEV